MKHLCLAMLMIFASYNAWSGSNLLDLLKAGKAMYRYGSCLTFIQSATHETLKSVELQKLVIKAKDSKYNDGYYFHYTNSPILENILLSNIPDRKNAQSQILKNGGYKSILEFQMTYADALSNVAGVGFYLAANPWSSASYGSTQVIMQVSPDATYLDYEAHKTDVQRVLRSIISSTPSFGSCDSQLQLSLLMNENEVDLLSYDSGSEWLVSFNEDIFTESSISKVVSSNVLEPIISKGYLGAVLPYVAELGGPNQYQHLVDLSRLFTELKKNPKLAGKSEVTLLSEAISHWTPAISEAFARYVSSKSGVELSQMMSDFKLAGRISDDVYLKIPLDNASPDFLKHVAKSILQDPSIAKAWDTKYASNMSKLVVASLVDVDFFLAHAPASLSSKVYSIYRTRGFESLTTYIIKLFLTKEPAAFKALSVQEQQTIIREFLVASKGVGIPEFVGLLKPLNLNFEPILTSFRFSDSFEIKASFFLELLKQVNNPSVVGNSTFLTSVAYSKPGSVALLTELKRDPKTSPEMFTKLFSAMMSYLRDEDFKQFAEMFKENIFSSDEVDLVFKATLESSSDHSAPLLAMLQNLKLSASEARSILTKNLSRKSQSFGTIVRYLKTNPEFWRQYTDLNNTAGIIKDLALSQYYLNAALIEAPEIFYRADFETGLLADALKHSIYDPSRTLGHINKFSDEGKVKLLVYTLAQKYPRYQTQQLLSAVPLTPGLVQKYGKIIVDSTLDKYVIMTTLLDNQTFATNLSRADLTRALSIVAAVGILGEVDTLWTDGVLDFETAVMVAFSLQSTSGGFYQDLKTKFFTWDDLDEPKRSFLTSVFLDRAETIKPFVRDDLWKELFPVIVKTKKESLIVEKFMKVNLSQPQQIDFYRFLLSTPERTTLAIQLFKKNEMNFVSQILGRRDDQLVPSMISYIEKNYPIQEPYLLDLYRLKDSPTVGAEVMNHFRLFACKKIKKFHGFDALIKSTESRYSKKEYRSMKSAVCQN